jgi:hypothetical protein
MWKDKAKSLFPEFLADVEEAETPYQFWFFLTEAFHKAYLEPRHESLISRVYEFAEWCEKSPKGKIAEDDLATCVSVSFIEHIPDSLQARKDMPRWFSKDDFFRLEKVFGYHLSREELDNLKSLFLSKGTSA